jgi:serine/threonine protein kinase
MQEYIHNMTVDDPSASHIPKVVDYFTVEPYKAYLIMEFVDGTTPAKNTYKEVADTLQWLRSVPAPAGAKIGFVGGGPARHDIFKDF